MKFSDKFVKKLFNMRRDYMNQNNNNMGGIVDPIIRNHIVWAMGAGLIPLPIADVAAVSAVQLDMIKQMSRVYGVDFNEMQGKSLITTLVGSSMARVGASAIKLIPGIGSIVGSVAMPVLSGASTFALGQVFKQHFETGGTFLDFDVDRLRKYYSEQFEKGKKVAEDIRKDEEEKKTEEPPKGKPKRRRKAGNTEAQTKPEPEVTAESEAADAVVEQNIDNMDAALKKLQDLAKLRDDKVITEAEFQKMKQKMMDKF